MARFGTALLDLVYPPTCLDCGAPTAAHAALCPRCFARLRPITRPWCPVLGLPFEVSLGPEARSAEAIADPPPFDRARSAVIYNEVARAIVSRLKYGDRPELAGFCARLMQPAGTEFWGERPVLVPVPLHRWRQFERRYNQSTELARALARLTDLGVATGLVARTRRTRQQVGLSADARQRNVAGAFTAHPDALRRLKGRGVVLVDDVITTGSTVNAITRALKRAGVSKIDVISFARVVTGADVPI
ncbi:MAG: Amidophosphoribosyltransferase [Devosia sp.]|uniref:ComF family protein n=1 Tax=Devosia sp. TaxID=1871048 RepID=UPI002603A19B|nr:ComF family protein [Devosia sp.]MDB5540368.1 Amidophosphoribosyltransferase [Devosia sp.]